MTAAVESRLVEELYHQRVFLLAGSLLLPSVAAMGFYRTGHAWFILWGTASFVLFAVTAARDEMFARSPDRSFRTQHWRRSFLIAIVANGVLVGGGAAGAVLTADGFTQMLVISALTAFVMCVAARDAVYPTAAVACTICAETPLFVACMATRNVYYMLYGIFIIGYCVTVVVVVRHLYKQAVRFLTTDEEKAELVRAVRRANLNLEAANAQLATLARTDALTDVPNRRSFDESLEREVRAAQRQNEHLSLLMLDIDRFKNYNDRYGHQAGDDCLRRIADALAACMRRPRDMLARYGGEEFAAILPSTIRSGALALGEEIRAAVAALALSNEDAPSGVVTVSIGASTISPGGNSRSNELIALADKALYAAKAAGRNRVHFAAEQQPAGQPQS